MDDAEVYLRWIQFCSFANIIRVHSDPYNDRRPWRFGGDVESTLNRSIGQPTYTGGGGVGWWWWCVCVCVCGGGGSF